MIRYRIDWWHLLGLLVMAASTALVLTLAWALIPWVIR